jgi:MoaA/NifB/PqqE/SkfB family radical SAM enzyme
MIADGNIPRLWVWMDVSATCNLACRDCYTKQSHRPLLLSGVDFEIMLRKLADPAFDVPRLHLNWRGEPLTNKHLEELLQIRREILPGAPLEFHTNGLLLSPARCKAIVAQLLPGDLVYVSVDGGCKAAHEANRGLGNWEPTLNGLMHLLDARDQAANGGPDVGIYEITYPGRAPYDAQLVGLSRRCDAWTRVLQIGGDGHEAAFDSPVVPSGPCFWAGNAMCITATGQVHVCLLSFRSDGVVGNLLDDDLADIVQRARAFRTRLATLGRACTAHCAGCRKTEGTIDAAD